MLKPHDLTTMAALLDEAAGHLRALMESELAEQRQVRHFLPDELEGSALMLRDAAGVTVCRHCDSRAAAWGVVRPSSFHYEDCPSGVGACDGGQPA